MNIFEINFNILQASSLVTVQIEKRNQPKILFQNKLIMFQFTTDLHLAFSMNLWWKDACSFVAYKQKLLKC